MKNIIAKTPRYPDVSSVWGKRTIQWEIEQTKNGFHNYHIIQYPHRKKGHQYKTTETYHGETQRQVGYHATAQDLLNYIKEHHTYYEAGRKALKYITRKLKEKGLIQ